MRRFTQKASLAALALALVSSASVDARPRAVAAVSPGGISVDVSSLRSIGLGPIADLVQASVARELAGGISGPNAAGRVVVRITGLSMNSYVGSNSGGAAGGGGDGGGGGGGGDYDYMEGDLLIVGSRGEVLRQHHQVSSSPASSGGPYYLPGAEQRRIEAISRNFAAWLKRAGV